MKRPGMVALLSYLDAQPGKSYVIIFDDLKRFARDTEFHIKLRREFQKQGARIECLNFRPGRLPGGEVRRNDFFAALGELEREQNRRQVIQKMKARGGERLLDVLRAGRLQVRCGSPPGHAPATPVDQSFRPMRLAGTPRATEMPLAKLQKLSRFHATQPIPAMQPDRFDDPGPDLR
jgi:DNA invertase Pin-like site-specific DNA recombinase